MSYSVKNLPKGMVEISIEVSLDELKPDLEMAAKQLSEARPIDGFRPGKAPYEVVANRYGEMAIFEAALDHVMRKHFVKAILDGHIHSYGQPQINITKLAPGNPIAFTATVAVIPHVESLADFRKITIDERVAKTEEKQVDDAVAELRKMQTREAKVEREAGANDKVVVDMDLMRGGVPLDGGQARDHGIYLEEEYYIPGIKEHVLGMKASDKKTFTLKFPESHFQKHLAGTDVDFALTMKEVYELKHPELDVEFAKKLGQESVEKLRDVIRKNMEEEAASKARQAAEIELLEKLVDTSKFGDIPDAVVADEVERMIEELRHSVADRGLAFEDYLTNIKKSEAELKSEFTMQAMKRVKTAILMREIGEKESIEVTDGELLEEVTKRVNDSAHDADAQERIRSEEYQDYLRTTMRNRKVLALLGKQIVRK